ncbi:Midasin [Sesamum alatum]|uniref:Midasin n=1 Tax=Sesamum alatum TaxID=300844 RepID=A0AAE1YD39_9LAMI|nr:Midasin [Sesamum alatum]
MGDRNTKFFHDMVKRNATKSSIMAITKNDGSTITSTEDIGQEFVAFYTSLLGTEAQTLSVDNDRKTTDSDFNFHPKCEKLKITHLLFADDLMLFSRGDLPSIHILTECLQEFRDVFRLAVNTSKSRIFTARIQNNELHGFLGRTEFATGVMLVRYLGIPLAAQRLSVSDYTPPVNKIASNISKWAAKSLSFAGRLELICSVIQGVECYWLKIFPLPAAEWQSNKGDSLLLQRLAHIRNIIVGAFGSPQAAIQHMETWSSSKGFFTSKAYEYFKPKLARQPWQTMIWKAFIPPKDSFILLLGIGGRLATWDRLVSFKRKLHALGALTQMNWPNISSLSAHSTHLFGLKFESGLASTGGKRKNNLRKRILRTLRRDLRLCEWRLTGAFLSKRSWRGFWTGVRSLSRYPVFDNLLKKGDKITEEELVGAVGELVLHPNYTIPLLGCFRPIAQKIVERTVGLLHLVPNLRSDDDSYMEEFDEDGFLREDGSIDSAQAARVIDVYVRRGKGLRLHELACLAFCRALDLIPSLLGSILNYFKVAPAPFERIMQCESVSKALVMGPNQLLNVLRASYRFLILKPEVFTTLWDWSCILEVVQQSKDIAPVNDAMLRNIIFDLRWCSLGILSVVLRLSFKASANLGLGPEEALQSFLRWQEFCMDVSFEKGGWYLESPGEESAVVGENVNLKSGHYLKHCWFSSLSTCPSMANDIVASNQTDMPVAGNNGAPFILTSAMTKSFEMVSLAVSQRWPVLLYGPAGCGKTALINKLAHIYGSRVLGIHMDEQIDGKTLLGSYVCTEQPGEFRWQPGSLTQAVLNGFWVVFEDIDKAPPDILSILLPLLEGAVTFSTGHGEAVRVNENFRLFSTVTSSNPDTSRFTEGRNSLGAVWRKVMVGPPSNQDLLNIVLEWYPELESLAQKLIENFERVNLLTRARLGLTASASYHDRFTLRYTLVYDGLPAYACDSICTEAIDIFASFSTSTENRLAIMREVAKLWSVAAAETLYPVNKPIIQELKSEFQVGRASLQCAERVLNRNRKPFVELRGSVHALERIACSVKFNEPVLLVGETGTGKTTLVQTLAARLGQRLTVLNLSQQSDVADLLGGFKPVDARFVCIPLYQEFENLFTNTFSSKDNEGFLTHLRKYLTDKNWKMLLSGFQKGIRKIVEIGKSSSGKKRKRPLREDLLKAWEKFSNKLERAHAQVNASDGMVFSFVEGAFITALRNGEWILLDEVNLAPPEILQRVIGVLEDEKGSLCLAERGDIDYVCRNPNFRLFACMNPATDAGKRDLPISLRGRFTEYFVDDVLDDEDLVLFINRFIDDDPSYMKLIHKIVQFYKTAKESEERLQDGANQKPHYSLRSLYRALEYLRKAKRHFGFERSLYDGFCMFFLNLLDDTSAKSMNSLVSKQLLGGMMPAPLPFDSYLMVKPHSKADDMLESYVLTKSVKEHLKNLARAIFIGRYPVLLQGPTSSGKTSLVWFLASITGHEFVRINNHEHTDLQEYLGSYITDASGKLVFHEGALVKAVRKGHWIVLDELNLAPSDVLEALNRLLDDNRELFVPELQETIRAHPDFMLFATQNPPVVYGGRKMLSRAFRNRFVEIHVDEIPQEELSTILEKRCKVPGSYARRMVDIMKELQLHRQSSKVFAGKHGFITPRDLFRWANRFRTFGNSYEDLAYDGFYLLAERLRDDAEKRVVKEVLEKQLRIKFSDKDLYKQDGKGGDSALEISTYSEHSENIGKIIWTKSLLRVYFLVERCYKMREPVLLVGETGGGKTTVCQLLSIMLGSKLHVLNCHQYTETSDFLGGFYPMRERSKISMDFQSLCNHLAHSKAFIHFPGDAEISMDINQASATLNVLSLIIKSYREHSVSHPEVTENELGYIEKIYLDLCELHKKWQTIFTWQDGPLVEAMKKGDLFLADEISLADDSVLERLNSVLEPERKLSLAEKGGSHLENVTAHPNFFLLATMNPGGDYGKKELSPALRNRFTEIWVPSVSDMEELKSIALERILNPKHAHIVDAMLNFWEWFNLLQIGRILTVRDLLSWVSFINMAERSLPAESACIHGAFLVLLDGLSLGTNIAKGEAAELRKKCLSFLLEKLKECKPNFDPSSLDGLESYGWADPGSLSVVSHADNMDCDSLFGINPFYIEKGSDCVDAEGFEFLAPTTRRNTLRVLRAMQLNKPVLLEGSPGVGKTSLIVALGRFSGHTVVRINLSEQTDIMDLLGSDLPVESDEGIQFAWSDGILLQALKQGSWVLLDELNLAPQSVLEGLNAILDHRAEVFIPELGVSFKCPTSFRVFACQNPSYQGGGRKGLPKSFLNRFTKVYVDELVDEDYLSICSSLFPSIERSLLLKLVAFNKRLHQDTMLHHKFGQDGSPWEFNLRDVIRSCQIIEDASEKSKSDCFLSSIYLQRMRTPADRVEVMKLYEQIFGLKPYVNPHPRVKLTPDSVIVGDVSVERNLYQSSGLSSNNIMDLPGLRHCLESVAQCVKHHWLSILVGPPSSGKTSMVRLLAELTGNVLNELNLSSATDISELLGCFEQHNTSRHYHLAIAQVERYMNEYCSLQLESSPDAFIRRNDLTGRWLAFLSNVNSSATFMHNPRMRDSVLQLVEIIERLKLDVDKQTLPLSWSQKELDNTLNMIRKLEHNCQKRRHSVKFEWVTGLLIKAIENGEWIVLENANLCNPTVLDRINSLVEQSGSITINECGIVEGKPVVLHPHPKFRMFLTVNPSYGEVSRAMRNRGVEIYLMQPYWLVDKICDKNFDEIELREVKRFIALSGIPVGKLVDMMAKAHLYAKHEGSHVDVSITYLELSRWVQLFQRLITNGNRPAWSIQISWEHTYLSSFGKEKGKDIVSQAVISYLSMPDLYRFTSSEDCLLCLPGGWPTPLKLRDYVSYSIETYIRQNVMYLESLGSQIASGMFNGALSRGANGKTPLVGGSRMIHLTDALLLNRLMFPKGSNMLTNYGAPSELELASAQKKLSFAADWAIEQANESDYWLYICWFEWFGSRLQPFFSFFNWFSDLLKKELQHSIWTRIFRLRSELVSLRAIDKDSASLPLLSMEFVDLCPSAGVLNSCHILLINSIKCVSLLRLSLQQWSKENGFNDRFKTQPFEPVLNSLRLVEEKVLDLLVESPSFDVLFKSYNDLLEHHMLFWNSIISSQIERRLISWRSLMKDAVKVQEICPAEAEVFQIEMKKLDGISSLCLNSSKSLLWAHGGHPILPSSADLYHKQRQLWDLCETVWPQKKKFLNLDGNQSDEVTIDGALFSHVELRLLAMQGICMSSYVIGGAGDNDSEIIQQLEEMYLMLLGRLDFEKQKLVAKLEAYKNASSPAPSSACCVFTLDVFSQRFGFDCWLRTQPIVDETSLCLDLGLLQDLTKSAVVDIEDQHHALLKVSGPLKSSMNFSLDYSSRPPTDCLPHQKILWTLDAWESVQGANEKISSFILELWFRWHATLWEACPMLAEMRPEDDGYGILLPHKLFRPLRLTLVDQILQNASSIRHYHLHSFQLRVASHNIWRSSANLTNSHDMLLSAARSLFQQIVYAHKKSFEDSIYAKIRSAFHSIKEGTNRQDMKVLVSLLASSNHHVLTSLIDSYIGPLLSELYPVCPSDEIQMLGCALIRIGGLRYNLLTCCDDLDPTLKYSVKYSQLTEKINSLEIEIQVRKECVYLAGSTHHREADSYRKKLLEKLNAERKRLQRKMVFRPDPEKYKKLKHLLDEFLESVTAFVEWIKDVKRWRIEQVTDQVHNWQEITSRFIDRLSSEYSEYIDITEPVQVAIYEMKLGLSLVVSGVLKGRFSCGEQDMESVLATIYKFLRFPRVCASKIVSVNVGRRPELSTHEIELPTSVEEIDMNMLRNIVGLTRDTVSKSDTVPVAVQASTLPLKVSVYHNLLVRLKDSVADARFLGGSSFKLLHEIFDDVASLWVKHRVKPIGECAAQQFKLRARAFKLESVIDIDVSNCANLLANDSFSEWQELLSEELDDKIRVNEEVEALEQDWNAQEPDLDGIVNVHNQLFGSVDLVQRPGSVQASDRDRLSSFLGSYMLGVKMTQDLKGSFSSIFDAKAAPEHLLRLCLEHDNKFILSHKSTCAYNFYKDSNPPMMAKLVEPVALLKRRILSLLNEWDDHPALQKIIEVIDMILALPLETPLAKALSAMEFLLDRVRIAQETVAKFPLSDQLQPIFALVSSWHKLEFESWPALLDEVQSQFERNAGKLWFPLYSVFQRSRTADIDQYNILTIESLEEFFNTSSIGEFKKQLQLLLSFHGHISNQLNWRSYASPCQEESVKILYNTFGFYVQLLPRILEHIGANRRSIEKELNELLKLCRWERIENYLAIESLKRTRLKLRKIIKKYMDVLQQPLMDFLGQETSRSGINFRSTQGQRFMVDSYEVSRTLLDTVYNQTQSKAKDSSTWFADWWKSLESVGGNTDGIKDGIPSQSSCLLYWEERKQLWRAFADLLKLLDGCGLSKHRTSLEGQCDKSQSWLLKPSYEVQHLLLVPSDYSSGNADCSHLQSSSNEIIWKTANKYYFKSIASIKVLEKICLNFHKDFSLIQVKRSGSYVDHLIEIQQEQRAVAYNFAKKLKRLRQCIWPLSNLFSSSNHLDKGTSSGSPFIKNQHVTFQCMWQQKQLFDGFCTLLYEEHLLLQTVENNHLNTCSSVKDGVEKIRLFIQKVLPDFQKSKNLLDHHLLGSCEDITMVGIALHPYGVTREMEQLVNQNFQLIKTFEKNLLAFRGQEDEQGAVRNILLGHMKDLCAKAHVAEELYSSLKARKSTNNVNVNVEENISELESDFDNALKGTYKHMIDTFQSIGLLNHDSAPTDDSLKNIKEWKTLFEKDLQHLQLDLICEDVIRTIQCAEELLNYDGDKNPCASTVCVQLRQLYVFLEMVLALGDNILYGFLDIHSMVSKVTHALANIFGSLFANGFGTTEDQEDDSVKEVTQDANGTGMGEGAGLNDVSDQINDEDQLLGTSEQANEERDAMSDMPSKNDKGIEMEQDFSGEAFSVSEDSEEDENEDNQDEQLESAMGEVGVNSDIVDEKLGDMDDDENENRSTNEKYEQGPSVKDKASQDEELRAKEDSAAAEEDAGDFDAKEFSEHNDKDKNEEGYDGEEDMNIDKDDAFADPSGINAEDQSQRPEQDAQMDELETTEPMEDGELEDLNDSDVKNDEEKATEFLEEADSDSAENAETANAEGRCLENNTETDFSMPEQDLVQSAPNNNNGESAGQPNQDFSDAADLGDSAPDESYANFGESKNDLAPTSGQPNASEHEVRVADTLNGKTLSNEQFKTSLPPSESLIQKVQPNPCRSVGDALDGWKERVKVSVDLQDQIDNSNDLMDENADEYGYTAEFTQGTAQALGPATADQINEDITQNDTDRDVRNADAKDPSPEIEIDKRTPETGRIRNSALNPVNDVKKQQGILDLEEQAGESMEVDGDHNQDRTSLSESLVSVKRTYMTAEINQLSKFSVTDEELGKANGFEPSRDVRDDAATLWRRYELLTTRLSQELAEQLRLIMEPTLANKLQGDYKTGKRINMKKVIPYVASHYRKDKIWLRRTRPNKRDYQVVIAVDDSRSMSEGLCGNFAMEALVTVCRAMSQLEVGNLAVASFGQQGNIKLLHDFDQPFTPEAGIKMISSLTFKQENTIADEPMADLLKYLNSMLDAAVMQARLPSGYNPLQQLVLIIADGRFNEKEKLKRYVRDILSKKRMVAFLLLDSPNESIMEFMEATVQGKDIKFSKYLDSFPFPYYVVLKNIEALPRTLADLLRQWFELMQYSRE